MKLYLKVIDAEQLAAADELLGGQESRLRMLVRHAEADGNSADPELRLHLQACAALYEQREALFYDNRELRQLVKGVYLGSDTCCHLMPGIRGLVEARKLCRERKQRLALLLPPVPQAALAYALTLLESYAADGGEVVVNDFGMLRQVQRFSGLRPVLGRLLHKTRRNAFLDRLDPAQTGLLPDQQAAQQMVLQESEYGLAAVRNLYRSQGVGRVGLDNRCYNLAFSQEKPRLHLDIYYPWGCLSVGRVCDIASLGNRQHALTPQQECRRLCRSTGATYRESGIFGLLQRRNAIYSPNTGLSFPPQIIRNDRNRLIFEPWL